MSVYGTAIYGSSAYGGDTPPPPSGDPVYIRHFTNPSYIRFNLGEIDWSGELTAAALIKQESRTGASVSSIFSIMNPGSTAYANQFGIRPDGYLFFNNNGLFPANNSTVVPLNEWVIVTIAKSAGDSLPTFGIYRFDTDTWNHTQGSSFISESGEIAGHALIGGAPFTGLVAAVGVWNSKLTTPQLQALSANRATNDWRTHAVPPSALWELSQNLQTIPVPDLSGGNASQIQQVATTVSLLPLDWTYENIIEPPPPDPEPGEGTYGEGAYGGGTYGQLLPSVEEPPPDPEEPPPGPVTPDYFPSFDIYQPPRLWRFILADSTTMQNIGEIYSPNFNLDLALNRPGSCQFNIPMNDDLAPEVLQFITCVKAYRKDQLVWSGYVLTTDDVAHENVLTVNAMGWFEALNRRNLRVEVKFENNTWTGGAIALNLLNRANNQRIGPLSAINPDGDGLIMPTKMIIGSTTDSQIRNRVYPKWQNIGQAIVDLASIENGIDFEVNPATRVFNAYPSSFGSPLRRDRPQAQFGYNWGPNNLRTFSRQIDGSTLTTQVHAWGPYGLATAVNPEAAALYGLFEEQINLSEIKDINLLQAYASGEVALKSAPRTLFSMNPFPYDGTGRVPEPFVDYKIGDQVYFTAKAEKRINIERQAIRVYGMKLTVDAEGNENLEDLQLSY